MQIWSTEAGNQVHPDGSIGGASSPDPGSNARPSSEPLSSLQRFHLASESQRRLSQGERQMKIKEQAEVYRTRLKKVPWWTEILQYNRTPLKYNDTWIGWYDVIMLVLLIYVALVAPFQVAFVPEASVDVFFVLDRFVDAFFLFDLGFNFVRPQSPGNPARDLKTIRRNYTKPVGAWPLPSQFGWDFISTIPYDLLSPVIENEMKGSGFGHLKVIRMIRLMRLLKLAKIIRRNSVFEFYEDKLTVSYATLEMCKLTIILLATCHWMACIWAMVPMNIETKYDCEEELRVQKQLPMRDDDFDCYSDDFDGLSDGKIYSWVTALAASKGRSYLDKFDIYLASLHFAVMTLTTVGYGDVAPQTPTEYVVCIILMLFSGIMWAYILGSLTAILSSMDPHGTYFKQTMDDVNYMLKQQRVDEKTSAEVRRYWRKTQGVNRLKEYKDLVSMMSPRLQGELEHQIGEHLFKCVPCIKITSFDFIMELCQITTLCKLLYPPGETILSRPELSGGSTFVPLGRCLCVVMNQGLVGYGGRVVGYGCKRNYWGEDFLLENPHLRNEVPACALSFVEVQFIPIEAIDTLLEDPRFNEDCTTLRNYKVVLATKRGLVAYAQLFKREATDLLKRDGKNAAMPEIQSLKIETTKTLAVKHWRMIDGTRKAAEKLKGDDHSKHHQDYHSGAHHHGKKSLRSRVTAVDRSSLSSTMTAPLRTSGTFDASGPTVTAGLTAVELGKLNENLAAIAEQIAVMSTWQQDTDKKLDFLMGVSAKRGLPPLGGPMLGHSSRQGTVDLWEGELLGSAPSTPMAANDARKGDTGANEAQMKEPPLRRRDTPQSKSTGDLRGKAMASEGRGRDSESAGTAEAKVPFETVLSEPGTKAPVG